MDSVMISSPLTRSCCPVLSIRCSLFIATFSDHSVTPSTYPSPSFRRSLRGYDSMLWGQRFLRDKTHYHMLPVSLSAVTGDVFDDDTAVTAPSELTTTPSRMHPAPTNPCNPNLSFSSSHENAAVRRNNSSIDISVMYIIFTLAATADRYTVYSTYLHIPDPSSR